MPSEASAKDGASHLSRALPSEALCEGGSRPYKYYINSWRNKARLYISF
jgi:hypothetical protein